MWEEEALPKHLIISNHTAMTDISNGKADTIFEAIQVFLELKAELPTLSDQKRNHDGKKKRNFKRKKGIHKNETYKHVRHTSNTEMFIPHAVFFHTSRFFVLVILVLSAFHSL